MARILVAEDAPSIQFVLATILRQAGHEVVEASDGLTAMRLLDESPPPDLVVIDLLMPGASGREVIAHMRSLPEMRQTPVVVVSGALLTEDVVPPEESYQALIPKPFTLAEVIDTVESLVEPSVEEAPNECASGTAGKVIQLKCCLCDHWRGNGGGCQGKNACAEFTV